MKTFHNNELILIIYFIILQIIGSFIYLTQLINEIKLINYLFDICIITTKLQKEYQTNWSPYWRNNQQGAVLIKSGLNPNCCTDQDRWTPHESLIPQRK